MIAENLAALFGLREHGATSIDRMNPRDPALAKMFGWGSNVRSGVKVNGETVMAIPAVLRGVEIISNAVMKVRPLVYKRLPNGSGEDDRERDTDHPNWKFVTRRVNPLMSSGFLRKTLTQYRILHGNGLAALVRAGDGVKILDAIPLLPDRSGMALFRKGQRLSADAVRQEGDEVWYWTIVGGELRRLRPENVLHIKGLTYNGLWGIDIVDLLCDTFGLSIAATHFAGSLFGQGLMPAGIVFAPHGMKADQMPDFEKSIRRASEGLGKAHRAMILEESAKYQALSFDPEKAQMLQSRQFSLIEIALAIGVQAHKLGDTSRMAYNSLEQSNQEHLDDDLDPHLQVLEDELGEKCLTEEQKENETHFVEFNRKALVRVNLDAQTKRDQFERTYGLANVNEIRRRNNQRPIGPIGDAYMVPANMTLVDEQGIPIVRGQVAPEPAGRGPGAPPPDEDEKGDREAFVELALHEVERLATRATREGIRQAKRGDGAFLAFLDELPQWTHKPQRLAPLLTSVTDRLHFNLDAFTALPYVGADLVENLEQHADNLIQQAVAFARQTLEGTE